MPQRHFLYKNGNERKMRKKELYDRVIAYFEQAMPVAETELHYEDPFQLLVAVILSAQCTDKRVNMITPALFRDFPTAEAMAATTKTANVIQSVVFHKAAMAVDTHVFRVSHRIGLVPGTCTTPLATEKHLTRYIPEVLIPKAHHWLILHGRYVCTARNPKCDKCGLNGICQASLKAKI